MFSIDGAGKISIRPEQIFLRKKFCRLENIDVCKGMCVVTDLSNRSVFYMICTGTLN